MLGMFWLLASCTQSDTLAPSVIEKDALLNFSIKTSSIDDALIVGGRKFLQPGTVYLQ